MNRTRNLIIVLAGIALVVVVAIIAGNLRSGATGVRTITITAGTFTTRLPETGQLQRPHAATLAALVAGNVGSIYAQPGQRVRSGALLATIVNPQLEANAATAQAAYDGALSRARKTEDTLPLQNRSAVVQARVALQQAEQDLSQGTQSGLGYGGITAQEQRLAADADVARTQTDLHEAQRIADADRDLFANKAISRDALDQAQAKLDQAKVAADQATERRQILTRTLALGEQYLRNRVRAQRDALQQAEANLAATQPGDVASARADVEKAAADLQFAQAQVARMQIRAPFDGIVQSIANETGDSLRPLQSGDGVTAGQAILTLAVDGPFIVRTKVDEQDVAGIALGQRAIVSGESFGGKTLPGHVSAISASAQKSDDPTNTSRQVLTTVTLERSLPFLRDGMTVDVDLVTNDLRNAIAVPTDAVRRDKDNHPFVWVASDGKARRAEVVLGPSNDSTTVVRSGLSVGEVAIAGRNLSLTEGEPVKPLPSPSPSSSG